MTAVTTAPNALRTLPPKIEPRPAGFVADVIAVAGRALRAVPRDLESVMPPVFIALFFFLVNVGTLQKLTEHNIPNFDFRAFQMPTAILLGVTGVSRRAGPRDRRAERLLRPAAAHSGPEVGHPARAPGRRRHRRGRAHRADHHRRLPARRAVRDGSARDRGVHRHRRALEPRLLGVRVLDRVEDGEPGCGELRVPALFPVPVPHDVVRARESADGLAEGRRLRAIR